MECNCALTKSGLACCLNCTKRGWRCISHFPLALAYSLHSPQPMGSKGLYMKKCLKPCWPELPRTKYACLQKPNPFRDTVPLKGPSSYCISDQHESGPHALGLVIYLWRNIFYLHYSGCHSMLVCRLLQKFIQRNKKLLALIIRYFNLNCSLFSFAEDL